MKTPVKKQKKNWYVEVFYDDGQGKDGILQEYVETSSPAKAVSVACAKLRSDCEILSVSCGVDPSDN